VTRKKPESLLGVSTLCWSFEMEAVRLADGCFLFPVCAAGHDGLEMLATG